jgi:hypothetical protein
VNGHGAVVGEITKTESDEQALCPPRHCRYFGPEMATVAMECFFRAKWLFAQETAFIGKPGFIGANCQLSHVSTIAQNIGYALMK